MVKSSWERTIEKQRKENAEHAKREEIRQRANSVVSGQPMIGTFRIMDGSSEEILRVLLEQYTGDPSQQLHGSYDVFPKPYQMSAKFELEKLSMYGMITTPQIWINGIWELYITSAGLSYFENKDRALEAEKAKQQAIPNIFAPGSNIVFGNVTDSTLSIDNSITQIERMIDEKGGEDAVELKALLAEVQELLENMKDSRYIPKNSNLFSRLSNHLTKHGWFYGTVVNLIGTVAMQLIQG
jgi:glutaredoxin